ncbi:MAG: class B sortase [Clostridiales Family XIII bacterium]|jgi:sortase B|nr:class B sortase [Clostridiales Family XIII bacterium]
MSAIAKQKKKRSVASIIINIIIILLVIVIAVCAYKLLSYYIGNAKEEKAFDQVRMPTVAEETTITDADIVAHYKDLLAQNADFVGWITMPGTQIDYPVMQTISDPEFYLKRDFSKEDSSKGTPFMSERSTAIPQSLSMLIFGHHWKDGSMFQNLDKFKEPDYFDTHKTIIFDTVEYRAEFEVIGAVVTDWTGDNDSFKVYSFDNNGDEAYYNDYLAQVKSRSIIQSDFEPTYPQKLIALSTCEYSRKNGRIVVIGAEVNHHEWET